MGSLGVEAVRKKTSMWLYPKVMGAIPCERWGHSACSFNGLLYVFGGCRGGLHFDDVRLYNLETMAWYILRTSGQGPGPRDSHSAALVGHKMIIFGGTNGSRKVNDLHILDLWTREWTKPECHGNLPSPRESHSATLVRDEKMVIFGGSGEGDANYLNDLHVLDLKTMAWTSPELRGNLPVPRDSHSAVAIGNRLFVYGGDSGDQYQGDVFVLDVNTMTWSKMDVHGPSPGVRAGHASVSIGTKMFVIGGVGDKQYYNDVWILDVITSSWTQLQVCNQSPQGRFSHTATITDVGITIYGGCGEDERPLNELVILKIEADHTSARRDIFTHRLSQYSQEKKTRMEDENYMNKTILVIDDEDLGKKTAHQELELAPKQPVHVNSDLLHRKRRKTGDFSKMCNTKSEQEEHSLSLSQHSSPSQSDQEQTIAKKCTTNPLTYPHDYHIFKRRSSNPSNCYPSHVLMNHCNSESVASKTCQDLNISTEDMMNRARPIERHMNIRPSAVDMQDTALNRMPLQAGTIQNLIGAEIRGQIDGAFDSGYLMTATLNGKILRGVLFAPGPDFVTRGAIRNHNPTPFMSQMATSRANAHVNSTSFEIPRHSQQSGKALESGQMSRQAQLRRSSSSVQEVIAPQSLSSNQRLRNELQGLVLTLGVSANEHGSKA